MATVGEIVIDVTADVGPLMRQMNKAEGAMSGLQGAAGRMGGGLQRAGGMAVSFGRNMAVVAAGVAAVTGAALAFARSSAAFGDAIGDASKAAGMSTTAFQEYRFALKEAADMTDDEFASAAARLNKTLGEARQGSEAAVKAFDAIGISQAQLASGTFNTDAAMAAYVATMEGMKDPTIAAAVSADLFGKAGAGMGAALSGVPGQVKSLVDQAREMGVVLGPEAVAAAGAFDEKMNTLTASFQTMAAGVAISLMPALNDIIDAIQTYVIPALGMDGLGGAVKGAMDLIVIFGTETGKAFTAFRDAVGGAVDWVTTKFDEFMALLDRVAERVKTIVQSVRDAIPDISIGLDGTAYADPRAAGGGKARPSAGGAAGGAAGGQMLGAAIVNGAVLGAANALEENREALAATFNGITQIARDTLGINSPSTVFAEIGGYLSEGMAQGIEASNGLVKAAVTSMGAGAVTAANGMTSDILAGLDTLLAGSQKAGAALALVNTFIGASQEIKKGTFGFATAAKVIAQGMGFVKAIKGAKKGGASSAGGGGGGGASAAPAQQPGQTLNFNISNDPFGFGDRIVRQIATQLNEASRNGMNLRATIGGSA